MKFSDHLWNMSLALEEAEEAFRRYEVPVGAIIINEHGAEIARSYNVKEKDNNPCGHAEILAIQKASATIKNWRLNGCTMYVTLEPCPMCLGAMIQSRISNLIFGAYDPKGGAISLGYNLYNDKRLNHSISIVGGIKHLECGKLMSTFFRQHRVDYKTKK